MAEKMKAVVKTERAEGAEFVEKDVPKVTPDQVLVKVQATSICGTDVHIYQWDEWSQGRIKNIPQILGHELAGEVVEVGSAVTKAKIGDYVSVTCTASECQEAEYHANRERNASRRRRR